MELTFLGTGAGLPSKRRNVTAIALNLLDEAGCYWLFDCGEGTQHQILHSHVKLSRLTHIFITHLHGDHIYGLPGLLTSRSYQGGIDRLTIFGPRGIRTFVDTALKLSGAHLTYELKIKEIAEEGVLWEDGKFRVEAANLQHRMDCYGFRIVEKDKTGRLDADRLRELGVPPGPLYGRLKSGETVTLPDGRVVDGSKLVGPPISGRVIAILGDTRKCDASVQLAKKADVLVHEATFSADKAELAREFYHSTTVDAAEVAREAGVRTLILTHISSRYGEDDSGQLLQEARAVFPDTFIAHDGWTYTIPAPKPDDHSSR